MRTHHSLIAWERSRAFVLASFRLTTALWQPSIGPVIDQLRRSALSVQLNIAEGYPLRSPGLFRRHLTVASGSAVEAAEAIELLVEMMPQQASDLSVWREAGQECGRLVLALKHAVERPGMRQGHG